MTARTADRIDYDKLTALVNARPDRGTRRALHAALNGINDAEETIRARITQLRHALDATEQRLDATRMNTDSEVICRAATDLDRAAAARRLHSATAAALLTEDELGELTSATPAHGK